MISFHALPYIIIGVVLLPTYLVVISEMADAINCASIYRQRDLPVKIAEKKKSKRHELSLQRKRRSAEKFVKHETSAEEQIASVDRNDDLNSAAEENQVKVFINKIDRCADYSKFSQTRAQREFREPRENDEGSGRSAYEGVASRLAIKKLEKHRTLKLCGMLLEQLDAYSTKLTDVLPTCDASIESEVFQKLSQDLQRIDIRLKDAAKKIEDERAAIKSLTTKLTKYEQKISDIEEDVFVDRGTRAYPSLSKDRRVAKLRGNISGYDGKDEVNLDAFRTDDVDKNLKTAVKSIEKEDTNSVSQTITIASYERNIADLEKENWSYVMEIEDTKAKIDENQRCIEGEISRIRKLQMEICRLKEKNKASSAKRSGMYDINWRLQKQPSI